MADIAPDLLEAIKNTYGKEIDKNKKLKLLIDKIKKGEADYEDMLAYANEIGACIRKAFADNVSEDILPDGKMYYNIAERLITPMYSENYNAIAPYCAEVQTSLNEKAGIGLKGIKPAYKSDKAAGLASYISGAEKYSDREESFLQALMTSARSIVDDSVKENAEFHYQSGMSPKIVRRASAGACEWCRNLEGVYDYEDVRDSHNDVFRRHANCNCTVVYKPSAGRRSQDVWSKKWREDEGDLERRKTVGLEKVSRDELKRRRLVGLDNNSSSDILEENRKARSEKDEFAERIASHPKMLAAYTPKGLKRSLERAGFDVKPMNNGQLKGVPFEDGGGYKVNFRDGGLIMYHPEHRSHHGGEYYKISTGKGGTHRYDIKGNEITKNK